MLFEQITGNYLDPRLLGRQLALSGLTVLVALMFWTWVWGILGALLAVPMTLLLMIVMVHVEPLQPIALFLSNAMTIEELKEAASD